MFAIAFDMVISDLKEHYGEPYNGGCFANMISTIRKADLILVFHEGKIVQRGTHDQLVEQPGIYSEMCKVQQQGAAIGAL